MDDADLTKKAIDELMREMDEYKELEKLPTERKVNPLGRPNKRFLGRTINSMMTHNKRESDRNHQRCQRKLRELDAKQRKREIRNLGRLARNNSENSHIISSGSEYEEQRKKKCKSVKKKKKKKRKKKQKSSTSSSPSTSSSSSETESSSTNSSNSSKHKNRKKKRHKKSVKAEEYGDDYYKDYPNESGYYVNTNMAYAVMAYNQMNHLLQQQQKAQQEMVKEELEDSVEIPSDLGLSENSETSLNISLNSSSAEEDENGILTFHLSSDEEDKSNKKSKLTNTELYENNDSRMKIGDIDKESIQSHISLESEDSQNFDNKKCEEIYLLSSSASDSEDLEIVESVGDNTNTKFKDEVNVKEKTVNESINYENATILEKDLNIEEKSAENENLNEVNENFKALEKENSESLDLKKSQQVLKDIEEKINNEDVHTTSKKEALSNITMVDLTDE